jgi:hypothetical protein
MVMFCEFLMVTQSPVVELILTFSMVVPFFPSMTTGADEASALGGREVAVGVGLAVGTFVALGELEGLGEFVALALGELEGVGEFVALALGELVALGLGVLASLGVDVGDALDVGDGTDVGAAVAEGTVKVAESLRLRPFAYLIRAFISCSPPPNVDESSGFAEPTGEVPPKSKGACRSFTRLAAVVPESKVNVTRLIVELSVRTNMYASPFKVVSLRARADMRSD